MNEINKINLVSLKKMKFGQVMGQKHPKFETAISKLWF